MPSPQLLPPSFSTRLSIRSIKRKKIKKVWLFELFFVLLQPITHFANKTGFFKEKKGNNNEEKYYTLWQPWLLHPLSLRWVLSCKFAPDQHDGDTVAASEFYPIDTSAAHAKKMAKIAAIKNGKDSVGIYYVGSNSTKDLIELVSYPSRRDTMMYSKTRHIKVKGNADINHVVRVDFYLHNGKDSLVKYVEEVVL